MSALGVYGFMPADQVPAGITFTVDNITLIAVATSKNNTRRLVLYENDQAGTSDYIIRSPLSTSPALTKPAGSKWEIPLTSAVPPSTIVGYIIMVSGSVTFCQEEYP